MYPLSFYARVGKRVLPNAFLVILFTIGLIIAFIPVPLWKFTINELIASSLQIENWELFRTSTSYLDRDNPQSPFQQFWALSMQMQFNFILPLVFLAALKLSKSKKTISNLIYYCLVIFIASLSYSILKTNSSPNQAYFNTFMRLWEFYLGVLLSIALPHINVNKISSFTIATLKSICLIILITFGFWVPDTLNFPGGIALIPVISAAALIVLGKNSKYNGLTSIIRNKYISGFGKFSFSLYLCHWPILITYQHYLGSTHLNLQQGTFVITIAISLSVALYYIFERPTHQRLKDTNTFKSVSLIVGLISLFSITGLITRNYFIQIANERKSTESASEINKSSINDYSPKSDFQYWLTLDYDRAHAIDNCLNKICYYGDLDSNKQVVLFGASHAAHYQPLFESLALQYNFKLITVLSYSDYYNLIDELNPNLVISSGTVTPTPGDTLNERVPNEWKKLWTNLSKKNIPILLIRDTPRFNFYQNACLWKTINHKSDSDCSTNRSDIYNTVDPLSKVKKEINNSYSVDFQDLLCNRTKCFSSINNTPVYYDKHHFSNRFILQNTEIMSNEIRKQAPDFYTLLTTN